MYKAIEIAKYVVSKCYEDGYPISNLQLQKILYFIQKTYLQKHNHPLFQESIEAWQFGPVVPTVYYFFCFYGSMKITIIYQTNLDSNDQKIINDIVQKKRLVNPWDLVEETHVLNGAWDRTYQNGLGNKKIISHDLIRKES